MRTWSLTSTLRSMAVAFVVLGATSVGAEPDVVTWISGRASPLAVARASDDDVAALASVVAQARVVALGTPVYGARELHQLQARMVSYLVREHGFTAVVLEAPLPEARDVDAWIGTMEESVEDSNAPAPLSSLSYRFWQTEEMRATLQGLRGFDRGARRVGQSRRHVTVQGLDMLLVTQAVDDVLAGLEHADPRRASKVRGWLSSLGDPEAQLDDVRLKDMARRLDRLETRVLATDGLNGLERRSLRVVIQHVAYARAFPDRHMAVRADAMMENLRWILDREGEGGRVILWMHAGHIATKPYANLGRQLREELGEGYVTLGFTFGQGSFAGIDGSAARRGARSLAVAAAPLGVLEGVLAEAHAQTWPKEDAFLIDLRVRPTSGPVARYFGVPQAMRNIEGAYDEMAPEQGFHRIDVPAYYDALVFVDRVVPTTARP